MIIPALDLINGHVVRLFQGDYQQQTHYDRQPHALINDYLQQGASLIHIVDLDGAKDSRARQLPLINTLLATTQATIQVGGGIRSEQDIIDLLAAGASRIVIGSLAVTAPALVANWLKTYGPEQILLALDVNIDPQGRRYVATSGWQAQSNITVEEVINYFIPFGLKHLLCTDISRDGTLTGSNVTLYRDLCSLYPTLKIQASGGIGRLADIEALNGSGVSGIILGRALLEGKFSLEEAITCWQQPPVDQGTLLC